MEEDKEVPLILGRLFLARTQALIDVKSREFTLRVGTNEVKFNLYSSVRFVNDENATCMKIDI